MGRRLFFLLLSSCGSGAASLGECRFYATLADHVRWLFFDTAVSWREIYKCYYTRMGIIIVFLLVLSDVEIEDFFLPPQSFLYSSRSWRW